MGTKATGTLDASCSDDYLLGRALTNLKNKTNACIPMRVFTMAAMNTSEHVQSRQNQLSVQTSFDFFFSKNVSIFVRNSCIN